jgi:hypothetical protein
MASIEQGETGLQSLAMGCKIADLCRAILILLISLELEALSLLTWMIASLLETCPIALTK